MITLNFDSLKAQMQAVDGQEWKPVSLYIAQPDHYNENPPQPLIKITWRCSVEVGTLKQTYECLTTDLNVDMQNVRSLGPTDAYKITELNATSIVINVPPVEETP